MSKEKTFKKNQSTIRDVSKSFIAETIYIGKRSANNNAMLRIYDKKNEQLDRKNSSFMRHVAKELDDWIRFEAEFKGDYAHQLTDAISNCETDLEVKDVIVGAILDRYGIYYTKIPKSGKVNRPIPETKKMIALLDDKNFSFSTKSSRNSLLSQSIDYIKDYSGLFPLLYKVKEIFGDNVDLELLEYLFQEYYENFIPNDDHIYFVNKYKELYKKEGKPWLKWLEVFFNLSKI